VSGLDKFDIVEETFTHYSYDVNNAAGIVSNWSTVVFVDSEGFVWVGTEAGLSRFNAETEVFTNFKHDRDDPESLSSNMIQAIYEDSRNIVWIGTSDGLNRYEESTHSFEPYYERDGLVGNRVAAITEDDKGRLWVSTDKGLSMFNPQNETFRNYDQRDGLQGNIFFMHSAHRNGAGELFFGGRNGFNAFRPAELMTNQQVPRVVLTDFKLFDEPVQAGVDSLLKRHISQSQQISLEHNQSVFSIRFVALNYRNSQKNQYAYMMKGFDKDFVYADSDIRSATYTNLDPGHYTFHVKASNNDGVWNEEGTSIDIIIAPPWWETWWFVTLLVGIGCLIVKAVVVYIKKLAEEISERKQSEDALQKSEKRFKSLFEQAGDYILVLEISEDKDLIIVDANLTACETHGYLREEFLGKSIMDLDRGLDEKQAASLMDRIMSGESVVFETAHVKRDGTIFSIEVSSKLLDSSEGLFRIVSIERDITERKRMEEERERLLHDTDERVKELLCMYAVTEAINKQATLEEIFKEVVHLLPPGWQYPEITRTRIRFGEQEYVSEPFEETEWKQTADIIVDGQRHGIIEVFYLDGRPAEDEGPFLKEERALIDGIAHALDEAIEHRESEHHRRIAESQVIQSQKLEAVGTLAGGIAHDFNNILGAMIGFTELAQSELPPESAAAEHLNYVLGSSERAKDLIGQILTFSRRKDAEKVLVMPHAIIKEALKLIRSSIPSTIEIVQNIDTRSGSIMADPTQFHQIIVNLCTNAYQAINPDNGTITVTLEPVDVGGNEARSIPQLSEGAHIKLTVRDTGCGMDTETLGRVFEPFFTTKEEGKGTGLGMSTVYGIVQTLNGAITTDSKFGSGTTFTIYLPRVEETKETPDVFNAPASDGDGEHILVVDDEELLRKFASSVLRKSGYKVTTCPLASEAVAVFSNNPEGFDLVVTDYTMPRMNGVELTLELHRIRPEIPVILMTGFSENLTDDGVREAGICKSLEKPLSIETFRRAVREVLDEIPE